MKDHPYTMTIFWIKVHLVMKDQPVQRLASEIKVRFVMKDHPYTTTIFWIKVHLGTKDHPCAKTRFWN